jgi:protein-L-isoaspartate(D-aspartate) O-methyltransferase
MQIDAAREQMVHQQVRAWDVLDPRVLAVLGTVPRERFVPLAYSGLAFADAAIPLGHGEHMLAPKIVGRILQAVAPEPGERALEVGTGSGYLTACLAAMCGTVRSIERQADLAARARANLSAAGVGNAEVVDADAFAEGALGGGTYDIVVLTGSLPVDDRRFQESLALGGRLFVIVGDPPAMDARLVTRVSADQWSSESLFETVVAPLRGAPRRETFRF